MGFSYNVNVLNQKGSPALYTDTFANRPAAGYAGRLFIANDTSAIYEDTGTAWVLIANVSSGAGTLQQVTTNGNTSNVGISVTAGGVSTNSATITSLTQGSVPFVGAAGLITQDNTNLFFDDTNNRLGINTNTPSNNLDVHGSGTTALIALNNTASNQSLIAFAKNSTAKWRIGNSSTDTFDILNVGLATNAITISSASNSVSFLASIKIQQGAGFAGIAGFNGIGCDAGGFFFQIGTNTNNPYFNFIGLTGARTYTYPDASGTLALTSDLAAYLPLTGGTLTGALNGTSATFSVTGTSSLIDLNNSAGNQAFIQFSNTSVTKWKIGNSSTNTFDILNNNLSLNAISIISANNNVLLSSNVDDTVNKLQVTGSGKFTSDLTIGIATAATNVTFNINGFLNKAGRITFQESGVSKWLVGNGAASENGRFEIFDNTNGTGVQLLRGATSWTALSDERFKDIIEPIENVIEKLKNVRTVIGKYKTDKEGTRRNFLLAQDLQKDFSEVVDLNEDQEKAMGVRYTELIPVLLRGIQEQQIIIDNLLQRIEILENK
jgi:hypothetical protein